MLVVDNASVEQERRTLTEGIEGRIDAEILLLDRNLGYAGGNNLAMERLFARGCEYVLLLNSDTLIAPGSIDALVRAARSSPSAGPLGPRVAERRPGGSPLSLGERYWATLLWLPRSLVRVRARRQRPYPVSGVTGCALLVPRTLYQRIGGFDETLFAYYEEVDLCLRARDAGFRATVVPEAEVGHAAARGFAGGMTPLAAWLKSRNLHIVGERRVRGVSRVAFEICYHLMVMASAAAYLARGRGDVAAALMAGGRAAGQGHTGAPPAWLFAASGYAGSGGVGDDAADADAARQRGEADPPRA